MHVSLSNDFHISDSLRDFPPVDWGFDEHLNMSSELEKQWGIQTFRISFRLIRQKCRGFGCVDDQSRVKPESLDNKWIVTPWVPSSPSPVPSLVSLYRIHSVFACVDIYSMVDWLNAFYVLNERSVFVCLSLSQWFQQIQSDLFLMNHQITIGTGIWGSSMTWLIFDVYESVVYDFTISQILGCEGNL